MKQPVSEQLVLEKLKEQFQNAYKSCKLYSTVLTQKMLMKTKTTMATAEAKKSKASNQRKKSIILLSLPNFDVVIFVVVCIAALSTPFASKHTC